MSTSGFLRLCGSTRCGYNAAPRQATGAAAMRRRSVSTTTAPGCQGQAPELKDKNICVAMVMVSSGLQRDRGRFSSGEMPYPNHWAREKCARVAVCSSAGKLGSTSRR